MQPITDILEVAEALLVFKGLGFRVKGFRVRGKGFRVEGEGCRVSGLRGLGLRV